MRTIWTALMFLILLALGGCSPGQPSEAPPSNQRATPSAQPSPALSNTPLPFENTPEPTEMSSNPPPAEKFVSLARKDLAERLKIDPAGITLVQTIETVWPNAALGCPEPGKVYAQGKVPGYQIRLEAGGAEYIYNTDLSGKVISCPEYSGIDSLTPTTPRVTPEIGVPIK